MPLFSTMLYVAGFTDTEHKEIIVHESFNRICIHGEMKVILVQRDSDSIVLYRDGKVAVEVNNGELVLRQKKSLFSNSQLFVIIPVAQLNALKITSDATVFTQGILKTKELNVDHRGNGIVKLSVAADNVYVCSKGKGKIEIEGNYKQVLARQDETGCMIIEYRNKEK